MATKRASKNTDFYRNLFESAYGEYHTNHRRQLDPVHIVHEYSLPQDQEIIAFLSALLAYGNVQTIVKSINLIRKPMGKSPHDFLMETDRMAGLFPGFRHRFTKGEDVEILLSRLKTIYQKNRSLEDFFLFGVTTETTQKERMSSFVSRFRAIPLPTELKTAALKREKELRYLLSSPEDGSACKRLNLFLRWMVRPSDGIDLGLWNRCSPSALFLPVDTHIMKLLKQLRWTRSSSATWRVVEEATKRLRHVHATDPIRYDFSLCHLSMNRDRLRPSPKHTKRAHAQVERRSLHQKSPARKLRRTVHL